MLCTAKKLCEEPAFRAGLLFLEAVFCFQMIFSLYVVTSGSMEPAIRQGAIVVVCRGVSPGQGDAAAYIRNGMTVIHRVISAQAEGCEFQGDANPCPDAGLILSENIEGKVVLVINGLSCIIRRLL